MALASVEFTTWSESVAQALDQLDAGATLALQKAVLVKPNLVNSMSPPVTTDIGCVEAVVQYVQSHSDADVVVAEGCADPDKSTDELFEIHGYTEMAQRRGIKLIDLNNAPWEKLTDEECEVFPEIYLPLIARSHYIISVPVLKAHSLADVTGSMKNMMGFAPPQHYQQGGHWRKAAFHHRMHSSIVELNRYRSPDLSVMDATVGMAEHHLGGEICNPPVNKILASFNARELDRLAAELLGLDWRRIGHLQ
jgi:uncharacterized protein (DUF362 family)